MTRRQGGFTLTELMGVMAVVTLLYGITCSTIGLFRSNAMTGSLSTMSRLMELARQTAIMRNASVWVVFTEPVSDSEDVCAALVGSRTGTDPIAWSTSAIRFADNADLELLEKVTRLPEIRFLDAGAVLVPSLPEIPGGPSSIARVAIEIPVGGMPRTFTRALQFSPTGEAKVSASGAGMIELGVRSAKASDEAQVAVFRVAGVTGKVTLYRPN